jgi:predicted transcriptional regulator
MSTVSIELDEEQARKLRDLAAEVRRPEQELCREALEKYLQEHGTQERGESLIDRPALQAMIGLVKHGPTDLSVEHDYRRGDVP